MAEPSGSLARRVMYGLLGATLTLAALAPTPAAAAAPVHITSLQNAGPNTGGVTIGIVGTGFQSGAHVRIGQDVLTPTSVSSTSISVVTPYISPAYGFFAVEVDNPDGGRTPEHFVFNYYEQLPSDTPQSAAHAATHQITNDQQLDVFTRGGDNTLHHTWSTQAHPAWAPWQSLGGQLTSAPTAVSWGNQNRIDVFVRGTDQALWHRWWDGLRWSGWETLGGNLASDPLVTSWGTGRLDVFTRGTDDRLWHRSYVGRWSGWESLGGVLNSAPGGVSWGPNRIDVFVLGSDGQTWHKWWSGAWSGWEQRPRSGGVATTPEAASTGFGELDLYVFGASTGNNLFHLGFAGAWGAWAAEGKYWVGNWDYSPGTASQSFKVGVDTFVVATDGTVWHTVTEPAQRAHARSRGTSAPAPRA